MDSRGCDVKKTRGSQWRICVTVEKKGSIRQRVLVIVSGGISAYRVPDLLSRLRDRHIATRCIMTQAAERFITPLTLATLSEDRVYTDLFSQATKPP